MRTLFLSLALISTVSLFAQSNVQWRGDRSGVYQETGLLKSWGEQGPQLLWYFDGVGEGHSSVAVSDGKIYVTGLVESQGYIFVFDQSGKLLQKKMYGGEWSKSYNGSRGTATIDGGKIYLMSGLGELICLDKNSLEKVWSKDLLSEFRATNIMWGINESPLVVDNKVIVTPGGADNNIVALNKNTGELIWSSPAMGGFSAYCSSLYVADGQVPQVVTMTENHIVGIDVATGQMLWSFENKNRYAVHANTPVYGDGMLLCTSGYGKGSVMLKYKDGGRAVEKVWESAELDSRIGAMVKIGDYAYGSGDNNKYWFCANWKTGQLSYKERTLPIGVVIAADGMLYCYSDRGDMALVKVDPAKFEIVSRFAITKGTDQHWAHPVISNGVLYVRHGNALMAYKVR